MIDVQPDSIRLELLMQENLNEIRAIRRDDVSEAQVDTADTIMELTQYGLAHGCIGHTYVVRLDGNTIGLILLGEAIPWETDPEEMQGVHPENERAARFYERHGFRKTDAMEGDDRYYIRYPGGQIERRVEP